jgi:hypothetical protein
VLAQAVTSERSVTAASERWDKAWVSEVIAGRPSACNES